MHATDEELSDRRSRTASDTTRKKGKAQDEAMTQSRSKREFISKDEHPSDREKA
jgi:hypothetical protein